MSTVLIFVNLFSWLAYATFKLSIYTLTSLLVYIFACPSTKREVFVYNNLSRLSLLLCIYRSCCIDSNERRFSLCGVERVLNFSKYISIHGCLFHVRVRSPICSVTSPPDNNVHRDFGWQLKKLTNSTVLNWSRKNKIKVTPICIILIHFPPSSFSYFLY